MGTLRKDIFDTVKRKAKEDPAIEITSCICYFSPPLTLAKTRGKLVELLVFTAIFSAGDLWERLKKLRNGLTIDEGTLKLLNKRWIVLDIANIKRNTKSKFYSPERERQILGKLTSLNKGPFPMMR